MYRTMVRIRTFEEHVFTEWKAGGVPGQVHLYSGQEAVAAGVIAHLAVDDYVVSTHRGHGHVLAKGADTLKMMAEVCGRVDGYCRGKGGTMHMADSAKGILGTNGIVGASLPIATGVGLSCQFNGRARCACASSAMAPRTGVPFTSPSILAAVWNLPVVYVCENNSYAMSTHVNEHTRIEHIADRGAAYGIPGVAVNGDDVAAVYEAAAVLSSARAAAEVPASWSARPGAIMATSLPTRRTTAIPWSMPSASRPTPSFRRRASCWTRAGPRPRSSTASKPKPWRRWTRHWISPGTVRGHRPMK